MRLVQDSCMWTQRTPNPGMFSHALCDFLSRGPKEGSSPRSREDQKRKRGGRASDGVAGLSMRHHQRLAGLTWVTIMLSGWLAAGSGLSESPLSGPLASALSSRGAWERIAATHSSTWRCRKLFQVNLKNRSWGQAGRGRAGGRSETAPESLPVRNLCRARALLSSEHGRRPFCLQPEA